MKFEPIINARLKSFQAIHGYTDYSDDKLFEWFVNDAILHNHQPSIAKTDDSVLESSSVGGSDDMGIDGIAIKVNDIFVSSIRQAKDLIELFKQISIEFVFIQSKNKNKIDSGEFGKFADGVLDFLSEEHVEPHNDKIARLLEIKDYLFSDDVILRWKSNPFVRLYYVIFGEWRDNKHLEAKATKLGNDICALKAYQISPIQFLDSASLRRICEENENNFSAVLNVIDAFGLNEVQGVDNSLVALLSATELIKILLKDDRSLRQTLFTDNVRDYQGETGINSEIMTTIRNTPSNFALLNNGITIVCSSITSSSRKITISNPQIVNGCQTCTVLFDAYSDGVDLSNVSILAKVIATRADELTTSVIRGTNSQNVVESEAFETARDFHKNLEEFFNTYQKDADEKIYYERRSNQYYRDKVISPGRIIGLKALTQSFVSVFLQSPHLGGSHEALLLKKFKNSIYVDGQSFLPYFTAALMCLNFEELRRNGLISRDLENRKHLLMFIVSESHCGICPSINDSAKIDIFSSKLIDLVKAPERYVSKINEANTVLDSIISKWIKKHGPKYRHGIKDNKNFTQFLKVCLRGGDPQKIKYEEVEEAIELRGRVIKVRQDRNGFSYGFIGRTPRDVFFHQKDNNYIDFDNLYGKTVTYRLFSDPRTGEDRAEIVTVLQGV